MKIDIKEALSFFDYPEEDRWEPHATPIIAILGEELNVCAFKHYLEHKEHAQVTILTDPVTTGHIKGKRLDRWLRVEINGLVSGYQCEIKNWASTAINGKRLPLDANDEETLRIAKINWDNQLKTFTRRNDYPNHVTKVFVKMNPPKKLEGAEIHPLILYWMPVSKGSTLNPKFTVDTSNFNNPDIFTDFRSLTVFSASLYLRSLLPSQGTIECSDENMSRVLRRLEILSKICIRN